MHVHNVENPLMMTQSIHRDHILIQACLPTLWDWEIVNVSGLSLRLSPTWAARRGLLKGKTNDSTDISILSDSLSVPLLLHGHICAAVLLLYEFSNFHSVPDCPYSVARRWMLIGISSPEKLFKVFPIGTQPSNCCAPISTGVKLKWKRNDGSDWGIRSEWISFLHRHSNEKLNLWKTSLEISDSLTYGR